MLNFYQAIILGALQGVTELFPVSSLGHSVVLPKLLNWTVDQKDPFFLTFLVATHAATALVLFIFFWKDWKNILSGMFMSLREREIKESNIYGRLGWYLIVATIPAGILGLLFEDYFKTLFASPKIVAGVLILNGLMLLGAEILRRGRKEEKAEGSDKRVVTKLGYLQAVKVGLMQCLALIPGFSRTGATITGSLLIGLSHEDAARFSFLLATPIIGAAAALKLPELLSQTGSSVLATALVGAVSAAAFAYLSVKFLTKYFETKKLTPFALYCLGIGIILSLIFLT